MNFEITDKVNEQDKDDIFQGLLEYNLARIEDKNPKDLGIYLQNEAGKKVAGLIGDTHGNWLSVKYLWVSEELRGQNIGSEILKQAEKTARERGCKYVFLDTFSFQAPEFYKKYGYKEVFAVENYPVTGKRYYFTKNL
ncbi:GNAT family N-acetyltransferase [Clostridium sp. YIM B02505]|uniref:GNAT family N-acetyltransferase n=1 Tax=Clostridium yunnanense TaxID=2800325 RepID=A0ABS1ESA7_9CLOT|nr:GNAT family N-acetyltransferase [Clostridium yunnanense]MBK1812262.1 GNAT family N-acetyltransferase [Clostridium yunnanense]